MEKTTQFKFGTFTHRPLSILAYMDNELKVTDRQILSLTECTTISPLFAVCLTSRCAVKHFGI